jgi:hypothetical protein
MKNQIIRNSAILGLFFMLAIASVRAQTPSRVEVTIPFDFSAGKANLKAGTYSIGRNSQSLLIIRSADGKTTALISAPLIIGSRDANPGERLVFNQYGDRYFLSQVWLTVDTGRQLFTSGSEIKAARDYRLANHDAKPRRVDLAARSK